MIKLFFNFYKDILKYLVLLSLLGIPAGLLIRPFLFPFFVSIPGMTAAVYMYKSFHRDELFIYYNHGLSRTTLYLLSSILTFILSSIPVVTILVVKNLIHKAGI
ncbi:MAG: hypothetical protein GY786_15200 [Proteobacteria bacterium]|nr:hypothetical protein [Pseudomonadota bacterium]